jgi:hypothetical protein
MILSRVTLGRLALIFVGLTGCQEYAEFSLTPAQQKRVDQHILTTAPTPQVQVNAIIEDQVKLIGYDIDKTSLKAGETLTITYYIEALSEKMVDNRIFVHLQGRQGHRPAWMNLDHHPIEGLLPLRKLLKGQVVRDTQRIQVKADFPSGPAHIYWGLFRGNHRLKIMNSADVKHDKEGRLILAKLNIQGTRPAPVPSATAAKLMASEGLIVDGKMAEPVWRRARWTPWWRTPNGKPGTAPKTRAKFAWDDANLYIAVQCEDTDAWSTFTERDSNTWEQEVVEIFIDADGDERDYLELQVTPANVVFDAKFAKHRSDLKVARAWNMKGLKTAVYVDGTVNKRDDTDKSWTVELAIPFAEVPGAKLPIKDGATWRTNLFRFDWPKGQKRQSAASFSPPIVPDFHALKKFGRLRFLDSAAQKGVSKPAENLRKTLLRPIKFNGLKEGNTRLRPANESPNKKTK